MARGGARKGETELDALRRRISTINVRLLVLLSERARLAQRVRGVKLRNSIQMFSPDREKEMLDRLLDRNEGPFPDAVVRHLFTEIFRASLGLMEDAGGREMRVARRPGQADTVIDVAGKRVGDGGLAVFAGPCAVEGEAQVEEVASRLEALGVGFLRGGAFKPRTSPYAFQGLGERGLEILSAAARRHGLASVTEILDVRHVELVARHADVVQVGARNMANYELLKEVATCGRPVLLKRGFAATLDELLNAAEYLASAGNDAIILCERGIRTFERETRFTLDISAVPLLRRMTTLPVLVDASHAAGRRDLVPDLARSAVAAGASGVMIEVHPDPPASRSDAAQQLDLAEFEALVHGLRALHAALVGSDRAGGR